MTGREAKAAYGDPREYAPGDRCPFCLATSDYVLTFDDGCFAACGVCEAHDSSLDDEKD